MKIKLRLWSLYDLEPVIHYFLRTSDNENVNHDLFYTIILVSLVTRKIDI